MEIGSSAAIVNNRSVAPRQIEELHYLCCERSILLDLVTDAIVLWSIEGTVKYWNRSAERMYGWSAAETIGKPIIDFLYRLDAPQERAAMSQTIDRGEWTGELNLFHKEGKEIAVCSHWYSIADREGSSQSILTIDSDITQQKLLERQFLRVQRLENLGTLASGIAHDLNNILTPILAITELLPLRLKNLDARTQHLLNTLAENSKRGRELVAQILSFARGGDGERTIVQPRHLLAQVFHIIKQTFPRSIEIVLQIENSDLWALSADANQLHQVLMNLCVNARDAMPDGGELTLKAENVFLGDRYSQLHGKTEGGAYVAITVADTGTGISPEVLTRIFEPFFTTKEIGKGTGLGLSTVQKIAHNHQGFVDVSSQIAKGTQFRVYLPALEGLKPQECPLPIVPALAGKGESILIVDDEPSIRETLGTTLEAYNYQSLQARDWERAIELYRQHHHSISTILLDYMMPGGNPHQTIERLATIDPNVRIIIMSGLSSPEIIAGDREGNIKAFLAKPFTTQDLLQVLKSVLN